jgi:GNAT superfamily N-acetyltransferase
VTDPIRKATPADLPDILQLIRDLAAYEREPDAVKATVESLHGTLFGPTPTAEAIVAEGGDEFGGEVVGVALYFTNFSTWSGRDGLYLEDLYVKPEARGSGLGKALLRRLARIAVARGCARVEWSVLDWNAPAIAFYRSLGAVAKDEWTVYRLDGDALARFGAA